MKCPVCWRDDETTKLNRSGNFPIHRTPKKAADLTSICPMSGLPGGDWQYHGIAGEIR
jgi:hypothetical protein